MTGHMDEGTCYCDCAEMEEGFFDDAFDGASDFGDDTWSHMENGTDFV